LPPPNPFDSEKKNRLFAGRMVEKEKKEKEEGLNSSAKGKQCCGPIGGPKKVKTNKKGGGGCEILGGGPSISRMISSPAKGAKRGRSNLLLKKKKKP